MVTRMPDGDWHHRIAGDLAQAQNPKQLQAQLQSKVDRYYSTPRSDGTPRKVAAVLMENGKVVTSTFVGTDNSGGKVNENTQFRLGSFSKFMTGLAVDSLVQDPSVNLDYSTQLIDVFSRAEIEDIFGPENYSLARGITLQQLVDQRTGIANMGPPDGLNADSKLELSGDENNMPVTSELMRHCKKTHITFREGFSPAKDRFSYSNLNATLAGAMMERVTGQPFQVIMQERVFNPFGMTQSGYDSPDQTGRAYAQSYEGSAPRSEFSDSHFFDPSGHIWSTPRDMCKLFSGLSSNKSLTQTLRSKASRDGVGPNYRCFSICNGGTVFGHAGGRDGYGFVGYLDTTNNKTIIVFENDGVANVDQGAAPISHLFGIQPYHGDPSGVVK